MKHSNPCLYFDGDGTCEQSKNGPRHSGTFADHDYQGEARAGFGSTRSTIAPRSPKMAKYYRDERAPAVREAVGSGQKPCQIQIQGVCTGFVEGLHEPASRGRHGGLKSALERAPAVPACHACNGWCSEHPKEAQELGYMESNTLTGKRHTPRGPVPRPRFSPRQQ